MPASLLAGECLEGSDFTGNLMQKDRSNTRIHRTVGLLPKRVKALIKLQPVGNVASANLGYNLNSISNRTTPSELPMDADFLRITLAVLGILLIAGLYLWERRRRRRNELDGQMHAADPDDQALVKEDLDFELTSEEASEKREPRLGVWARGDEDLAMNAGAESAPSRVSKLKRGTATLDVFKPDPTIAGERFPPGPMLVVLHVAARNKLFDGASIVRAARIAGLEPGDREIFHCKLGDKEQAETLFSMANMVKPGTFPFGAMAEFTTPGLTLFAQLDGQPGDPGRLEELLGTAHSLIKDLGGELRDDRRQPLTAQGEEMLRQRVMTFVTQRMAEEG